MPSDLEDLTYDQLYLLAIRKSLLKVGHDLMTVDDLRASGVVPITKPGEPQSLVQRIRARKHAEQIKPSERDLKKRRRKEHGDAIKAARARGEKI